MKPEEGEMGAPMHSQCNYESTIKTEPFKSAGSLLRGLRNHHCLREAALGRGEREEGQAAYGTHTRCSTGMNFPHAIKPSHTYEGLASPHPRLAPPPPRPTDPPTVVPSASVHPTVRPRQASPK